MLHNMLKCLCMVGRMSLVVLVVLDATASRAHAYIDPGAGSYALQVALAGLAGFLVSFKLILSKVRSLFHRSPSTIVKSEDNSIND